jgi:predicted RNA-binding Zn-ribbon protein involved in translation (DUF1610 family)
MTDSDQTAHDVVSGMREWRAAHPQATLAEIECAVEERLARLRVTLLAEAALTSSAADWTTTPAAAPRCPDCGLPLVARGKATRHLQAPGGQELALSRSYATCPACGAGLFPP